MPEQPNVLNALLQRLGQGVSQIPPGTNPLLDIGRGLGAPQSTPGATQAPQPIQPPSVQPVNQAPPQATQAPQAPQAPQSNTLQTLMKLGLPLGAAIAGSINPNLLPQAAGLSTGFTEEISRQEAEKGDKDFIIIDPETGEQQTFKVPKRALVQQKRAKATSLFPPGFGVTVDEKGELKFSDPGTAAIKARKRIEGDLPSFKTETEARKAGKKSGERVNIGGQSGVLN